MSHDGAGQRTRWKRASLLSAIALSLLSIPGCGGDSSTAAPSTTSTSQKGQAAFVAKADAVCERLRLALNAADRNAGGYTEAGRARLSVMFAAGEEKAAAQLAKLEPPASAAQKWQQLIAYRRALVGYHHKLTKYASLHETSRLESTYEAYKVAQRRMLDAFQRSKLGFKVCSSIG